MFFLKYGGERTVSPCVPLYTVSRKKRATLFRTMILVFLGGFLHFLYTNGNRNEYSTEKLQNLQLYPASLHYLIKLKPHKTAHFEVNRHSILLINSKNESMS